MLLKRMQPYWRNILKNKKIFTGNYYICKKFAMILIVLIVFTGCGQNRITEKEEKKETVESEMNAEVKKTAQTFRSVYMKEKSELNTLKAKRKIINCLEEKGYAAVDCDNQIDMVNREKVEEFCKAAEKEEQAAVDIVNIGIGIPEMVSRYARKCGMLDMVTLTVESGGIGGFPVSGEAFGAMIGAASVYDMANQFDLYDNGGLDICFMGALEVDRYGNINAHRGPGAFAGIGGFANITAKTPTVVFCMTFDAKGLDVTQEKGVVTIRKEGEIPKFVEKVNSVSFSAKRAIENGQKVLYVTERCVFRLTPKGLKLIEVYPGVDMQKDILDRLPFEVEI